MERPGWTDKRGVIFGIGPRGNVVTTYLIDFLARRAIIVAFSSGKRRVTKMASPIIPGPRRFPKRNLQ
jgi:hypothetical protein